MAQQYSDPTRENDPHTLPNVETFRANYADCPECGEMVQSYDCTTGACHDCNDRIVQLTESGWFYWFCFPGCMPDSDPMGPFATEAEALEDAQQDNE